MSDVEFSSPEWWDEYKKIVNNDEEMQVRGHEYFSENFFVKIDQETVLIKMDGGKVTDVVIPPTTNDVYSFGVEGSRSAWEEFIQEVPSPFNQEVFGSHVRTKAGEDSHLELKGNKKKIYQYLRPLQRSLELMRETHNS